MPGLGAWRERRSGCTASRRGSAPGSWRYIWTRAGWKDDAPGDEELLADLGLLDDEICEIRRSVRERVKELVAVFG